MICLMNRHACVFGNLLQARQLFPKEVDDDCTEHKAGKYCE